MFTDELQLARMRLIRLALCPWRFARHAVLGFFCLGLVACGGGRDAAPASGATPPPLPSAGQVAVASTTAKVSYFAASRFADQVSFGATPALVADIRAKGLEAWIEEQFVLPLVPIDLRAIEAIYAYGFNTDPPKELWDYLETEFGRMATAAPDQLRLRVMWALSQFVVAGATKGEPPGHVVWTNLLYRQAFGRYGDLLREASLDSHMAHYLDNDQNRPKSAECPQCAPNENYARELMQLFSLGVFKLNADGTPQRDSRGRYIETYTQNDVEELARALTGWTRDPVPANRPPRNWGNWGKPMVPSTWPPERDSGRKVVMGKVLPAGQSAPKDLDDVVDMLMAHPNIAPFVALRLIQHLVKSDPSPAYVARVAARFRNNGAGVAGDLKAVVKAVLLDAEARRGDNPSSANPNDGKFREPFLHNVALWRGLSCTRLPKANWNSSALSGAQRPFRPDSVFSFYAPTDRAPGSNLLAPEQKLLTAEEVRNRLSLQEWPSVWANGARTYANFTAASCNLAEWRAAFEQSPRAFNDLLSARFFRGAMPPTLRSTIEQMMSGTSPPWNRADPTEGALRMIGFALATPYFGVMK
jgi:uncharacterized protein (DUF1800 family)